MSALLLIISIISWFLLGLLFVKVTFFLFFSSTHYRAGKKLAILDEENPRICYEPSVSILVPAYNEELVLENCVESLLHIDYPDFEIVIIDDGSSDNTKEIGQKLAKKYPNVAFYSKQNGGKANALNFGIEQSKNEIVVCIDADSIFKHDAITHLVLPFANPLVGAVGGNVKVVNRNKLLGRHQATEYISGLNLQRRAFAQLDCMQVISGANGAFRRKVLQEIGGYSDDTIVEDMDITVSIAKAGYKIRYAGLAIAYTEAPENIKDFMKQRYRWIIGGFKVIKKHRDMIFNTKYGRMGIMGLPFFLIFPWVDVFISLMLIFSILYSVLSGNLLILALFFLGMSLIQTSLIAYALHMDREDKGLLFLVILESLWYSHLLNFITLKAGFHYLRGTAVTWNKLKRLGKNIIPEKEVVV